MTSAFSMNDTAEVSLVSDGDDDDALQVALAFVDEFQAPVSVASSSLSAASSTPPPLLQTVHETRTGGGREQHVQQYNSGLHLSSTDARLSRHEARHEERAGGDRAHTRSSSGSGSTSFFMKQQLIKARIGNGVKRATPGNTSNKARDGRKEELIYLRKKVCELELRLADSKGKSLAREERARQSEHGSQACIGSAPPALPEPQTGSTAEKPQAAAAASSVWQEIVNRQYAQRVKAERENIRLKLVLENQLKIARSLEKVLQKTTSTKDFEKLIHGKPLPYSVRSAPIAHTSEDLGGRLFEELLAGMDQSYAEAEGIFEANGLARTESAFIDAVIRSDDVHGIQLEVVANKVLPFDMRTAGSVVWHHYAFAKERLPNRAYHHNSPQTLNATEDTIIEDFNLEIDINSAIALFHVKLVMRRYSEESRVVIVWRAFFDPLCIADEPTPGVRFLERGYIVIKQCRGHNGDEASAESFAHRNNVLQTCYIATPVATGDLADADPAKVGAITDFVLSATAANISSSHEMIENVLLEHAIKSSYGM